MASVHYSEANVDNDDPSESVTIDTNNIMNPVRPNYHGFNMYNKGSNDQERGGVKGMVLIEPMQLFNIMMKVDADRYPAVSNPSYLLLLDARRRETYDQSHIALAKFSIKSGGMYELPYGANVETKQHIIVYDDLTEILRYDNGKKVRTEATKLAKAIYAEGARNPVKILRGVG